MDREFQKSEYSEISASLRHLNDIRLKMVQYCITLNGICLVFYGGMFSAIFNSKMTPNTAVPGSSSADGFNFGVFLSTPTTLLAGLSIFVTLLSLVVELLSSKQFELFSKRGKAIEVNFDTIGQFHISLEMIEKRSGVSVMLTGLAFYIALIVFWVALALSASTG